MAGNYISTIDGSEGEAGRFATSHAIWIDLRKSEPELYVADRSNSRFQVYDLEGSWKRTFGQDILIMPGGFALLGDHLVVAESHARLTILDAEDELVCTLGEDPTAPHELGGPTTSTSMAFRCAPWICARGSSTAHTASRPILRGTST